MHRLGDGRRQQRQKREGEGGGQLVQHWTPGAYCFRRLRGELLPYYHTLALRLRRAAAGPSNILRCAFATMDERDRAFARDPILWPRDCRNPGLTAAPMSAEGRHMGCAIRVRPEG
jgi:hypothetical protein